MKIGFFPEQMLFYLIQKRLKPEAPFYSPSSGKKSSAFISLVKGYYTEQ
jgi:hypothetical protein